MTQTLKSIDRWIDSVYPSKSALEQLLQDGRKVRIYLGVDPTSSSIHLGHTIPLRLLQTFQELNHEIIFLIGDFTARIGDPSGRDNRREPLTAEQVKTNFSVYEKQLRKTLSFGKNPPKIMFNSKWWDKMNLTDFFTLVSSFTWAQLSERDLFQQRIKKGYPIAVSEFLYPVLQGYDSVELEVDIEVGATDQTFNMLIGRDLLKKFKNKEKVVITTPLLEGTDGRKMSKSYANTIDLEMDPIDMYGKVMSINDKLSEKYRRLVTNLDIDKTKNPLEAKKQLAFDIVKQFHGTENAEKSQTEFERVFQKGGNPTPLIKTIKEPKKLTALEILMFLSMVQSKSEAKRLIEQGGVSINGGRVKASNEEFKLDTGSIISVGKRKTVEVKVKN